MLSQGIALPHHDFELTLESLSKEHVRVRSLGNVTEQTWPDYHIGSPFQERV